MAKTDELRGCIKGQYRKGILFVNHVKLLEWSPRIKNIELEISLSPL